MRVTLPKIPREDEKPIDDEDIRTILVKCHNRRLKTYLLVLARSGVRAIEACALRVCDIYFDESPVRRHVRLSTQKPSAPEMYISQMSRHDFLKNGLTIGSVFFLLTRLKKIDKQTSESLAFQVFNINSRKVEPQTIYNKLVQQFHVLLMKSDLVREKMVCREDKLLFTAFVGSSRQRSLILLQGAIILDGFWVIRSHLIMYPKLAVRAQIYSTKLMKYFTFLEYPTIAATGRNLEARINEMEKEKQIMNQKHEQEMQGLRIETDRKLNEIIMIIQKNPKLARLKPEVLKTRPLKRK